MKFRTIEKGRMQILAWSSGLILGIVFNIIHWFIRSSQTTVIIITWKQLRFFWKQRLPRHIRNIICFQSILKCTQVHAKGLCRLLDTTMRAQQIAPASTLREEKVSQAQLNYKKIVSTNLTQLTYPCNLRY